MYAWSHIDADDGRKIKMMTFGPINIRPDFKRKGYGKILLDHSMELAKKMEGGCLLIVGNIDFYGKSSFVSALTKGIRYADDPEATYFLCKELDDGFLDGITGLKILSPSNPRGLNFTANPLAGDISFTSLRRRMPCQAYRGLRRLRLRSRSAAGAYAAHCPWR